MASTEPNTCPTCSGTGVDNDKICRTCMGRSTVPIRSQHHIELKEQFEMLDDVMGKVDDIKEKVDDVMGKVDDVMDKVDDVKEKVDEIKDILED